MIYKVISRKNPQKRDEAPKFYGVIVNMDQIGIEEIASRISGNCTVTRHDCLAVLSALQEQVIYALQEGKRVHLGDLGSFRVIANGIGADTAEEYNVSYFKRLKVYFTPNVKLRSSISLKNSDVSLQRVDFAPEEETETESEETV